MAFTAYAWAAGWGVLEENLVLIEADLWTTTRPLSFAPRSQPVDPHPVMKRTGLNTVRYDGLMTHVWVFDYLPVKALEYVLDTYFDGGTEDNAAMTIKTRRHELGEWALYNVWFALPKPNTDYRYDRQVVRDVRFTFNESV